MGLLSDTVDWPTFARQLVRLSARARDQKLAEVFGQLTLTSTARCLGLWGRCFNFDENARAEIVAPPLLRSLHRVAGLSTRARHAHAGVTHTYGYLLSTLKTPYGFKRDRWLDGVLEGGLGLEPGTLMSNLLVHVTWLLGRVAFRPGSRAARALRRCAPAVAPAIKDLELPKVTRIIEQLPGPHSVCLVTHLMPLPHSHRNERWLLAYTVEQSEEQRLVTGFPISKGAAEELVAAPMGAVHVAPRYNAAVQNAREGPGHRHVELP